MRVELRVELETVRLAIGDLEFTIRGEMHEATASLWRLLVPTPAARSPAS